MCINFYMNTPLSSLLNMFTTEKNSEAVASVAKLENYMDDSQELIRLAVREVSEEVRNDNNIAASNKNKEIVIRLDERGMFNLKNGVQECAAILGISKNTVYMHLRNQHKAIKT